MYDCLPREVNTVTILQFIEDAITSYDYEVMMISVNFEGNDIWVSNYNPWVSIKLRKFSLNITECATYWESARENTMRSQDYLTP